MAEYLRRTPKRLVAQRKSLEEPAYAQEATRAQAFDARVCRSFHCLLYLGEMYRLATEVNEEGRAEEMRDHITERMAHIDAESTLHILPLRKLVAIQAGSGLLALTATAND